MPIIHPMALRLQNYTEHLEEEVESRVSDLAVFSAIFENSSEGMILTDESEKITRVNRAFMKISGYHSKDVIGLTPRVLKSTRQERDFYEKMWRSIEESGLWSGEIINKNAKGEEYYEYLTILKLVSQESGKVNYVGIFSDLSQIHYNMRRLQDLIDLQSNIILVTDGSKMLFANRSLVRFFGYETLEQFLEKHRCISELFLQKENYFHPSKAPAGSNWVS
ncbi:MAG: PAS domain S-box protein [Epsilonproteobacteria bacterium]|nr:PAS domain S-box protein [Campylobacterota bacterium]